MNDAKKHPSVKPRQASNCEHCEFYDYDEQFEEYVCSMSLDEDERVDYLTRNSASCPYFRFYDEYKSVHKQI